jgi:hypothetical protein
LSKPVWKQQSNKEYETNHSAYKSVIINNVMRERERERDANENLLYFYKKSMLQSYQNLKSSYHRIDGRYDNLVYDYRLLLNDLFHTVYLFFRLMLPN